MNLYFGLFCSTGVLFNSSELGFDFFAFAQQCLTKKLEEKTIDSYSLYVRWFGFYTQQNVNSAANFVFTSKTGLPRVVLVLWWVLFVPEIFVSPLSEFEKHMYSSDPRLDTGSLMQLESRRAVPQASQPPIIQSLSQDILIIPQLDGCEVKNHCRLRDHAHFFHFLVFR